MIYFFIFFKSIIAISFFININSVYSRAIIAFFLSFCIALILYQKIICLNRKNSIIGEKIRDLGLFGQKEKEGTPTMGGIVMIFSTLISTIFFSTLNNVYVLMLIMTTLYMGCIGFIDDCIKIKYNKKGLSIMLKILSQILLGIFVGITMYFNTSISIQKQKIESQNSHFSKKKEYGFKTSLPIFSSCHNYEFDYAYLLSWYHQKCKKYAWVVFIPIVIGIITFLSNGANITDGIDGLTAGISSIIFATLSLLSIISSNKIYSYYFHFIYIPHIEEIIIFSFSFLGSLISFLWYNTYPAQIFMGDTGSLTIGGVIATLAIINRKELTLPILCGIFFIENISVIIQVLYFKYSKKKYGIGKRIFLMAPLHHHFQKIGYHENKIFNRFIIIQMMLSMLVFILLII
ncbi:phospho-N-acetylmuramoyl-pentapeptide-transferase [Blattabacterium sp. (Blaberus giganteus)]|uniref:phospho-N-acetylmuramoyl-pentapeptide- transferase n=1 Tax=Blattabacterium sp. (Blaberus giganteus) TaxID=1186051 RepID=UPI00025F6EF9|nr:phospho-N-acetylmuramoyl-pentapeptide-transferase [Blattabacterium sp. (Blaberus giganteus)]AFJ90695.1 phospho-N-acetylmuramoyl-pentapeptide-transferase [Blattabacterium sp. (Blaberus giganteus)]